jgi:taurine transport system substrate-binding protein
VFPSLAEQAGPNFLGGATVQAIADTAAFLAEQCKNPAPLADYSAYVNASYVAAAAAQ